MAQQEAELDKNWTKSTARSDELEALIVANKDFVSAMHYHRIHSVNRVGYNSCYVDHLPVGVFCIASSILWTRRADPRPQMSPSSFSRGKSHVRHYRVKGAARY